MVGISEWMKITWVQQSKKGICQYEKSGHTVDF